MNDKKIALREYTVEIFKFYLIYPFTLSLIYSINIKHPICAWHSIKCQRFNFK